MKTICCINQKGGVGKTTIALATAQGIGGRVLFVDLDPQRNASSVLGVSGAEHTSLDVLEGECSMREAITDAGGIDAVSADSRAANADKRIEGVGAEYRLKEALDSVSGDYDYCIIDTPPALGILAVNALTASDVAVIPAQADIFSLEGIGQLASTIQAVRTYSNVTLGVAGIVLTRYNARTTLSREIRDAAQEAADALETRVFDATIREGIAVKEAQAMREPIFDYAPRAKVTQDFRSYISELEGVLNG